MYEDIDILMERHGATVIAVVAGLFSLAQLLLGALELNGPLAYLYQGLFASSMIVVAYVIGVWLLGYPRYSLSGYFVVLSGLVLVNWLHEAPWLAFPSLISGMMLVILLQQLGRFRLSIRVFLVAFLLFSIQTAIAISGLTATAIWIVPLVVLTGALVLDKRSASIYGACCIATIIALGVATDAGLLAPHLERTVVYYVVMLSMLVMTASYLGVSAMTRYRAAYEQSQQLSRQLANENREASEAREQLQAVIEFNPVSISVLDTDGRYLDCNRAWEVNTGISREKAIGRTGIELGLWPNQNEYETILSALHSKGSVADAPARIKAANGTIRQGLAYLSSIGSDHNKKLVGIWLDQTDRLAAEAMQRDVNETLELRIAHANQQLGDALQDLAHSERLASLGSTVAGIAHELNTPIGNARVAASTLRGVAQDMKVAMESGPLRKLQLQNFIAAVADISELIDRSVVRAADLVSGYKQLVIEQTAESRCEFDFASVAKEAVAAQQHLVGTAGPSIHVSMPAELLCDSYPEPLAQVIAILLKNAIVHAFVGRPAGRIDLDASFTERMVCLNVRDNGIGMDDVTQSKVFDPFFTHQLGHVGAAIGLGIAHRITRSILAGRLTVRAAPGEGSCFTLEFPRVAPGRV